MGQLAKQKEKTEKVWFNEDISLSKIVELHVTNLSFLPKISSEDLCRSGAKRAIPSAMGSSDRFCLRWNDFETNISAAFQELRDDEDFFDVTLCCGPDGTDRLRAHKVILSAC